MSAAEIELALLCLGASIIGTFAGGLAGVGAVLLIGPIVYFGAPLIGVPMDFKTVSNLTTFAVIIASFRTIGVYRRFGIMKRELFGPMIVPSIVGALIGMGTAIVVSSTVIQAAFALASIAGAVLALIPYDRKVDEPGHEFRPPRLALVLAGATVGVVGGLTGAGGGFLLLPMLLGVLKFPTRLALGTTAINGGIVASISFAGRAATLSVDWILVLGIGIGAVLGAGLGARLQQKVPTIIIRRVVAFVVGLAALRLLLQLR
jgi:uncharacterized membrane protein YfcA